MNHSANFGVEGVTDDPDVIAAREQAAMNMIGMLLLSLGTPMMLAGDEFRNTQDGNNNAYCQDNDITWLKWDWMYSTNKTREMRRLKPCLDWWRCVNHWTCITTRISSPD